MYSRVETITPEIAEEYMMHNKNNRRIKERAIKKYANDIASGKWQLSPQGISFRENGDLFDGQNRLLAIIKSGQTVDVYVTYDVPNDCTIADRGVMRSSADTLKMSGINSSASTTNGVALVNMLFLMAGKVVSDTILTEFVEDNEEMICNAISVSSRMMSKESPNCKKAPCMAAAFCALYCGVPFDCLIDFFTKTNTGFYNGTAEGSTSALKQYLGTYTGASETERKQLFCITTVAIKDFTNGVPRTNRYRKDVTPAFWKYVNKNLVNKYLSE